MIAMKAGTPIMAPSAGTVIDTPVTINVAANDTDPNGNLDPATLRESPEVIRQGVADTLASYGKGPGHVFNLGHGVTPDIDPDHVAALVDAVHELSPQYHD